MYTQINGGGVTSPHHRLMNSRSVAMSVAAATSRRNKAGRKSDVTLALCFSSLMDLRSSRVAVRNLFCESGISVMKVSRRHANIPSQVPWWMRGVTTLVITQSTVDPVGLRIENEEFVVRRIGQF